MTNRIPDRPRILFLFSDAGGGHRSAAEAIIEALHLEFKDQFETEMVDIMKQYGPPIVNRLPEWYPWMVRSQAAWKLTFQITDGTPQVKLGMNLLWPYIRPAALRIIHEHPCDIFVAVHPGATDALVRLLGPNRPPFITIVTDLSTVHAVWYHPQTDLCLVPTEIARQKALKFGWLPEKVKVVGLPVAERFCQPVGDRVALRKKLDWPLDRPVILLMGGGEGMGPLEETAKAIAANCHQVSLMIVTGRNVALRKTLESELWPIPVKIYGFVHEIPDFMQAADILVTKGGPGTISEALNANLPIIIYTFLPGQEEGNITYVVNEGAGVYAPAPNLVVSVIKDWIENPDKRQKVVTACQRLANPQSARQIAHILANLSPCRSMVYEDEMNPTSGLKDE